MNTNQRRKFSVIFATILLIVGCTSPDDSTPLVVFYDEPAEQWIDALPLGNGRLGAMVYGGTTDETIALNEITFWTGCYDENQNPKGGAKQLQEMRDCFFQGDYGKLHDLANKYLVGDNTNFGTHIPVGDMKLHFTHSPQVKNYIRSLNLESAIARTTYNVADTAYCREIFCSNPADVMIIKISADKPGAVGFDISFAFNKSTQIEIIEGKKIVFNGSTEVVKGEKRGVNYAGVVCIEPVGGHTTINESALSVREADEVVLYYNLNTDYRREDYAVATSKSIDVAMQQSYEALRQAHVTDYNKLFSRVKLDLGDHEKSFIPTDQRREAVAAGGTDNNLTALFMQYGRYLLIAGSRENSPLPLNLQGLWNDNLACNMAWTCDYHLDINTQQNYWNANVCNLAECNAPLFDYTASLVEPGRKTVKATYGTRGWTAHTTANAWGHTPCSGAYWWGGFPTGGTWLALHMIEHYRFTCDSAFILNKAYPILKENAQFLLDFLTPDPQTGYLLTGPSISPENSFTVNGGGYCLTMMPTVDRVLVHELFTSLIDVCQQYNFDTAFADSLQAAVNLLPPYQIGSKGQLQEWYIDYEERQPNHRHTSHLLGLYPYAQITTPELENACRITIENRLNAEGWEDTEWSRANMICYYARLRDAEKANNSIKALLSGLTRNNLFTVSPSGIAGAEEDIFCPDANMAGSAAIAEMLVQSHKGYIELLPALPKEWKAGSFEGLCVRGNAEVSAQWSNNRLNTATLVAKTNNTYNIKIPDNRSYSIYINNNKTDCKADSRNITTIELCKGDRVVIK